METHELWQSECILWFLNSILFLLQKRRRIVSSSFWFHPLRSSQLLWEICRIIIGGIARAVHYLNEECGLWIIHHDINPTNIFWMQRWNQTESFTVAKQMQEGQTDSTLVNSTGWVEYSKSKPHIVSELRP